MEAFCNKNQKAQQQMKFFVYILRCSDGSLYTGFTTNLEKRLVEHNTSNKGSKYTRSRRPVMLVYNEKVNDLSGALKREAEIKSWTRKQKQDFLKSALL